MAQGDVEAQWAAEQQLLRAKIIEQDDVIWRFSARNASGVEEEVLIAGVVTDSDGDDAQHHPPHCLPVCNLRYIGGVDISFVKGSDDNACACLVVLEWPSLQVVYSVDSRVTMTEPYIPGFLAFREVGHLIPLFSRMNQERPDIALDFVMVDGNGVLHPRGAGLACHLGVATGLRTIGLAKKFLQLDGMSKETVKAQITALQSSSALLPPPPSSTSSPPSTTTLSTQAAAPQDHGSSNGAHTKSSSPQGASTSSPPAPRHVLLSGASGRTWGAALLPTPQVVNPVYVSVGHRVSLATAIEVVIRVSRHRVPEPIRYADMHSRAVVRHWMQQVGSAGGSDRDGGNDDDDGGGGGNIDDDDDDGGGASGAG